jgi:hypothetical protein
MDEDRKIFIGGERKTDMGTDRKNIWVGTKTHNGW